jgi:hypothetical protein
MTDPHALLAAHVADEHATPDDEPASAVPAQPRTARRARQAAASGHFDCWTPERLRRLRLELGTAHLYDLKEQQR